MEVFCFILNGNLLEGGQSYQELTTAKQLISSQYEELDLPIFYPCF